MAVGRVSSAEQGAVAGEPAGTTRLASAAGYGLANAIVVALLVACGSDGSSSGVSSDAGYLDSGLADAPNDQGTSTADSTTDATDAAAETGTDDAGDAAETSAHILELCTAQCENVTSVDCPTTPNLEDCISKCTTDSTAEYVNCAGEVDAFRTCYATDMVMSCVNGKLSAKGCLDEFVDYGACVVCTPHVGDTVCTTCRRTQCCVEWTALLASPEWKAFVECVNDCPLCCSPPETTALDNCTTEKCATDC